MNTKRTRVSSPIAKIVSPGTQSHLSDGLGRERLGDGPLQPSLKQNLRINGFVGVTAQALQTQVWTALIAILILRLMQLNSTCG